MIILSFLVQLAGATMLLLYAVRMVRTGIERAFGASFRRVVTSAGNPASAAMSGLFLAVIMQSSAAVALLVAGFAGTGALAFATGLPVVLGADLGSALLIQVLSFKLEWLVPVLLALGGGFFINSDRRKLKQAGRIILGIAFILISLRFLRETMDPIRDSAFLPSIVGYLERDFVSAFLAGAVLAFVMHSSVAVILMCVTTVAIGAIPEGVGVSLVLGANLGSALIPIWLSRGMNAAARRVPLANLLIRGSGAVIALLLVNRFAILPWLGGMGAAQTLINVHILFNLLLLVALPFSRYLDAPMQRLLPDAVTLSEINRPGRRSILDETLLAKPPLALASLRREVLRMAEIVENMMTPVMELYTDFDKSRMNAMRAEDHSVNSALDGIRRYVAAIPPDTMKKSEQKEARELTEYAIALETAGDIVAKRLLTLAQEKSVQGVRLSKAGHDELASLHEQIMANMTLASNVLVSADLESARLLLEEKAEMTRLERASRKKHLKRLSEGLAVSFDSSDIHLETLRSFKDFNSQIAAVAYPILYRGGQLLETRLIENLESGD
ncbi:MAG: Na/Pi cotransporter family protein [Hyphomicrobiales bacterium]|nr:Na/Pi cotransporter family protein [Hyphomicrobiales bacterium]MCP5000083.1 Na/Pi cotransporter family protein [Hyphomicrobiales bacterium]